jgi:hypothetical protein
MTRIQNQKEVHIHVPLMGVMLACYSLANKRQPKWCLNYRVQLLRGATKAILFMQAQFSLAQVH